MDLVQQIATIIGASEPIRSERLQLARRQAEIGIDAIKGDDVKAARALLVDALDHLEQIDP